MPTIGSPVGSTRGMKNSLAPQLPFPPGWFGAKLLSGKGAMGFFTRRLARSGRHMVFALRILLHLRLAGRLQVAAIAALVAWPALCSPAGAQQPLDSRDPYVAASQATGVPLALLAAIAGAESAYHPWALNQDGRQIYCRSRAEAELMMAGDSENVDIGLMQVNFHLWGHRLGLSKTELLDPRTNLLAGARILKESLSRSGDLWQRIGAYHSSRPAERQRYNQEVYKNYLRYIRDELP